MNSSARLLASVIGVLALAAGHARADYMNWGYSTSANPPVVSSGTGTIQLTGVSNGTSGASIPILALQNASAGSAGSPDVYNASYTLSMTITDNANNDSRTLTLSGLLQGNLTANSSTVTNTLTGNSVTFGGHTYTVNVPSVTLTPPGQPQQQVNATISVADTSGGNTGGTGGNTGGTGGGVHGAPEPASLVLGALGFSFLGMGCWRNRQRRPASCG
jgi:hypothetical protein